MSSIDRASNTRPADELLHKVCINILFLADIISGSRLARLFEGSPIQALNLGSVALICLLYAGIGILYGRLMPVFLAVLGFALVTNAMSQFSSLSGEPIVLNAVFQFEFPFTFLLFANMKHQILREYVVKRFAIYAIVYALSYTITAIAYNLNAVPAALLNAITLEDPERGRRLFLYSGSAAYAWFYCFINAQETKSVKNLALAAAVAVGLILSLSRVFIILCIYFTILQTFKVSARLISYTALSILFIAGGIMMYGFVDNRINPFSTFSSDSSGSFRQMEYDIARRLIQGFPLLGIGIPTSPEGLAGVAGNQWFAAGDIGPIGIWFNFGAAGLFLFFVGSTIACRSVANLRYQQARPLFLAGCCLSAYGCIAPAIFDPTGGTIFAIILGLGSKSMRIERTPVMPEIIVEG